MVALTDYERATAAFVHGQRATGGYSRTFAAATATLDVKTRRGINGVCGEIAFGKGTGIYWPPSWGTYHDADLPPDWQTRTRPNATDDLCYRPGDPPEHKYALVTGPDDGATYTIHGWIYGFDCSRPRWAGHSGGMLVYYVPRRFLNPLPEVN